MPAFDRWNHVRYRADARGHYESWFIRGNHPTLPRAFWIRYTIFSPKGRPGDAVGERWAMVFDGEAGRIIAAKSVTPIGACEFSDVTTHVKIGASVLDGERATGDASGTATIAWDLRVRGDTPPLLALPERLYGAPLPKAKLVVPQPNVAFEGSITVDGEVWAIDRWVGSQNHNWGSQHTDFYAWGQVAGFDDAPGTFLECATARLKFGPLWTPPLTILVLRLPDAEIRLNTIRQSLKSKGEIDGLRWSIAAAHKGVEVDVHISAPREAFVGLTYANPPGGSKTCLNSKLARCDVSLRRPGHKELKLRSEQRGAFEILTDDPDPQIPIVA